MQDFGAGIGTVYGAEEIPYKENKIEIIVNKRTGPEPVVGMARIGKFPSTDLIVIILENDQYPSTYPLYIKWKQDLQGFYTWRGEEVTTSDPIAKDLFDKLKKKVHMAGQDR